MNRFITILLLILVKFMDLSGEPLYINPENVSAVMVNALGETDIIMLTGSARLHYLVKETPTEVAKKLQYRDNQ